VRSESATYLPLANGEGKEGDRCSLHVGEPGPAGRQPLRSLWLPECPNGHGEEVFAEAGTRLSVVQHNACSEPSSSSSLQLPEAAEVLASYGRPCFHLDAGDSLSPLVQGEFGGRRP